jgi:anti-anti-sigma factor
VTEALDASVEQRSGGVFVVTVAGTLDIATAPTLEAALGEVAGGEPRSVLLELDDVTFVDSSGLRVLVAFRNRFGSGDPPVAFLIDGMSPAVERLLEISGLLEHLARRSEPPGPEVAYPGSPSASD